jgi:hypothetical protein
MFETYRMLGREHEADLAREAATRARAAEAQDASPGGGKPARGWALMVGLVRSAWPRLADGSPRPEQRPTS